MRNARNIVLIGMPGAGKSTLGVLLAKALSRPFLDTDIHIQAREGTPLAVIIRERGIEAFKRLEERHVLDLACRETVIATGGSVVYSPQAMAHLRAGGVTVYLELSLGRLEERIQDMDARGIVRGPGQDLATLYRERGPLYASYADAVIPCDGKGHEQAVREIVAALAPRGIVARGQDSPP